MSDTSEQSIIINEAYYTLLEVEQLAWKKLVNGSVKKKNGFRTMCVGTTSEDGSASQRIVVNRKVDEENKTIFFHTDNRSRKIDDLQKDNRISILFYDTRQSIQIIVKAIAAIHTNDTLSHNRWHATSPRARLGYMTINPPNSRSESPTLGYENRFTDVKPTNAESNPFEINFSVIACQVYEMEFIYLNYNGNRKANFYYENGVLKDCFWAVP